MPDAGAELQVHRLLNVGLPSSVLDSLTAGSPSSSIPSERLTSALREAATEATVIGVRPDIADRVAGVDEMSLPVDLIEWLNGGRAFTTMFLINFASWDKLAIPTLIHELTHVWQGYAVGPVYMVEALEAQASGEGYNYGYTDSETGDGAQDELNAAAGNFNAFNREQEAQIIQHYYVRRFLKMLDFASWQPYADVVHA